MAEVLKEIVHDLETPEKAEIDEETPEKVGQLMESRASDLKSFDLSDIRYSIDSARDEWREAESLEDIDFARLAEETVENNISRFVRLKADISEPDIGKDEIGFSIYNNGSFSSRATYWNGEFGNQTLLNAVAELPNSEISAHIKGGKSEDVWRLYREAREEVVDILLREGIDIEKEATSYDTNLLYQQSFVDNIPPTSRRVAVNILNRDENQDYRDKVNRAQFLSVKEGIDLLEEAGYHLTEMDNGPRDRDPETAQEILENIEEDGAYNTTLSFSDGENEMSLIYSPIILPSWTSLALKDESVIGEHPSYLIRAKGEGNVRALNTFYREQIGQ
jgi:hypothetical protein